MFWRALIVVLALAGVPPAQAQNVDRRLATEEPSYLKELDHAMALCMSPQYRFPGGENCISTDNPTMMTCDLMNHPPSWTFLPCERVEKKWKASGGPDRKAAAEKAQYDADRAEIERLAK